jgi:S-formylglutathione hydrolase FrmB
MAWCQMQFFSTSLGKMEAMNVLVPEARGPFPVLVLLHGLSDNYSAWQRRSSIERHVEGKRLIVAMPDGGKSFYANHPGGDQYENHIVRDVVGTIDRTFHTILSPEARAIAGLSMGGYGAVMLALRHPELFSVACSHSGALEIVKKRGAGRADLHNLVSDLPIDDYDCYGLVQRGAKSGQLPAIRFDCGRDDFLIESNRHFHAQLEKLGVKHEYAEYAGEHNWAYWDKHVPKTIAFVLKHLNTEGRAHKVKGATA